MILEKVYDELYGMIEDLKKKIQAAEKSDVTITPALESGTKLADFEIDGTEGSIYAPTIPTPQAIPNVQWEVEGTTEVIEAYRIGDLVIVDGHVDGITPFASTTEIISGLPEDNSGIGRYPLVFNDGVSGVCFFRDGSLYCGSTLTKNKIHIGICYVAKPQTTRTKTTKKK